MSPLINSRLLLVLDYMLYQFTYPPPDLTYQVRGFLLSWSIILFLCNVLSVLTRISFIMCLLQGVVGKKTQWFLKTMK